MSSSRAVGRHPVVLAPVDPYALISRPDGKWLFDQAVARARFDELAYQIDHLSPLRYGAATGSVMLVIDAECMASAVPQEMEFSSAVIEAFNGNVQFARLQGGRIKTVTGVEPVRTSKSFVMAALKSFTWGRAMQTCVLWTHESLTQVAKNGGRRIVTEPAFKWSIRIGGRGCVRDVR